MGATLLILTILIPWGGALLVWWIGDTHPKFQHRLAVIAALGAGICALRLLGFSGTSATVVFPVGGPFGDFTFVPDGLGVFLAAVATVIGSLAVIFSVDYMKGEHQLGRYYAFVLFFIGAMVGLVLTSNILLMFVFWEITALCSYALISFHNDDPKAVAGGMKALIMTQLGGVGLLAGALFAYTYTGSYDIAVFIQKAPTINPAILAVMAFGFLIAAAAKSAQFPFQTWLPDAMEAPTPISALIHAATMVNAGVYLLARFYPAFSSVQGWTLAVMLVGMITALLAALMALVATDLKRVLAYSTVSQLGYMVYAIGCGNIFASQFHLLSHAVFKALLFLSAGAVIHSVGTRDMRMMGGLAKKMPVVATVFTIGALALAGIPPLNGFWSKELVLEAGFTGPYNGSYYFMLLGAGLTALYTARMVWMVFFGEARSSLHAHDAGTAMKVALIPLALGTLSTWLLAGSFSDLLKNSLPFHEIEAVTLGGLVQKIFSDPLTYTALLVVAVGIVCWFQRQRLQGLVDGFSSFSKAAQNSFGFEAINRAVVKVTQDGAEALRPSQTGVLAWNVAGILAALIIVLLILIARV